MLRLAHWTLVTSKCHTCLDLLWYNPIKFHTAIWVEFRSAQVQCHVVLYTSGNYFNSYNTSQHRYGIYIYLSEAWGRLDVSVNWVIIGSGNGLVPGKHQVTTWTNGDFSSITLSMKHLNEISFKIQSFSFNKM